MNLKQRSYEDHIKIKERRNEDHTALRFLLRLLRLRFRPSLEANGRIFVHAWLVESVGESLRPDLLSLNVDAHPGINVQDGRIRTE